MALEIQNNELSQVFEPRVFQGLMEGLYLNADPEMQSMMRMYEFFDRLVNAALPRIRDFRGLPTKAFDGRGNYSLGLREQLVFPEIEYDKIDRIRGMQININTTAKSDEEGKRLLELLGMPFAKSQGN